MTISSENRVLGPVVGNGVATGGSFTFKVFNATDVIIVETSDTGVDRDLVYGVDYSVTLNADQDVAPGGTFTYLIAGVGPSIIPTDYVLNGTSDIPNLQGVELTNNGGFFPRVLNNALDRLTILVQQLVRAVNSSIKFPLSDGTSLTSVLPNAEARALKALIFDASGNATVSTDDYVNQTESAAASAAAAAASESAAAASEAAAAVSEAAAAASESAAAASEAAAAASESAAAASEAAAAASEAAAAVSESAAAASESAAAASEAAAAVSESAAAASEAAAAVSESAAAASAVAAAASAAQLQGTSATSVAISTGTKVFTTQSGKLFDGQNVRVYSAANNANYMDGLATYSGVTLSVDVVTTGGSGTLADWVIKVNGAPGATGATGATGAAGTLNVVAAGGTANAITANYTPDITLTDLTVVGFVAASTNTSATVTFTPDGLTARNITKRGGQALSPGDIIQNGVYIVEYNSANTRWELLNPALVQQPWVAAGGTAQAITATYAPAISAVFDGLTLAFRATAANTAAAPTFSPNGLTARAITKAGGVALVPGDIAGNLAEYFITYNLANTRWELRNPSLPQIPWVAAGGTADAITATYAPAISTLFDGLILTFRATAANATTTPTFSPNGLTARTIVKKGGTALAAGDIPGNLAEVFLRYNLANTRWELLNPAVSGGGWTQLSNQNSTSGTGITFTGIPSSATQIVVTLSAVSTTGSSGIELRAGSGSLDASGYVGSRTSIAAGATAAVSVTTGYPITGNASSASSVYRGAITLTRQGNTELWVGTTMLVDTGVGNTVYFGGGARTFSAAIDRVGVVSVNGTDTFDAGVIGVSYI